MADTKFTPGPWEACSRETYQSIYGKGYERAICQVDSYSEGFGPNRAERDANAHLIASAPELYAMLAQTAEYFSDADGLEEDEYIYRQNVRAALAKARGEVV